LSRDERGFRYVVKTADNGAPYVEWNPERVTETAEDVLAVVEEETPRERATSAKEREAADWLRQELAHGPIEAASIYRRSESIGISDRSLKRAARTLGVLKEPAGFRGAWHWGLPPESSTSLHSVAPSNLSDSARVLNASTYKPYARGAR
jgi:hypothetical protein